MQSQSIVGTNNDGGRPEHDFYPTPPEVTQALLDVEDFTHTVWEPACGNGAISEVLKENGYNPISTDLIDYGYGQPNADFFKFDKPLAKNIVTNPPFKLATDWFVYAIKDLKVEKMALLCKLAFLEGLGRTKLLMQYPPIRIHVFRNRITLTRNGEPMRSGGMIAFAWFVWEYENGEPYKRRPSLDWISSK